MKKIIWLFIGILLVGTVYAGIVAISNSLTDSDMKTTFETEKNISLEDSNITQLDSKGNYLIDGQIYNMDEVTLEMVLLMREQIKILQQNYTDLESRVSALEKADVGI